ncbi:hypothetical protein [Fontivita pretiosa]|uniref:hypothetical protein n=1 Tax=Fontivita pretiosa TaxID=2989684 RepID=UPI003D17C6C7
MGRCFATSLTCVLLVLMLGGDALAAGGGATTRATDRGQWWQIRGDRDLIARSKLRGNITSPAILWKHRLAARETLLTANRHAGQIQLALPAEDVSANMSVDRLFAAWGAAPPWHDLDGDGKLWSESWSGFNVKLGKMLPDTPGLQAVICEALNYPDREPYLGKVTLKFRQNRQWAVKWQTTTDTLIWVAEPIFGDFDRDGQTEIALLPWYKLNLLDARTGQLKEQAQFKLQEEAPELGGRAYGWFGAVDLDGQGRDEFVIIDDFVHHMAVMGWRDGRLTRLWNWIIHKPGQHMPAAEDTVAVVVNPEPVQDLDGDGRREIVVNVYNHERDGLWHTLVLDGMTGRRLHDLAGWFMAGSRDLDGDGSAELLCWQAPRGLRRPDPAPLAVFSFKSGRAESMWTQESASYQLADLAQFPDHVNSGAAEPRRTVLCGAIEPGGRPVFFTRRRVADQTMQMELTAWQHDGSGIAPIGRLTGPRLEALAVGRHSADDLDPQPASILLRANTLEGESDASVSSEGFAARVVVSRMTAALMSPVVVGRMKPEAPATIIAQGAAETIEAIRPRPDGTVQRLWRIPGRATTCNNYFEGAVLADVRGDGSACAIVGTRGPGDCARLLVVDADGREVWHRDFEEFAGTPPPWNVPGLMYWQGGYFRDRQQMDILVQLRRIGGETWLLDGRSGQPVWFRSHSTDEREFGRAWFTIFDYNRDGCEDVLSNYPDVFCVADGPSGQLLLKKHARDFANGQGYYGWSIAGDLLGDGDVQILYTNANGHVMLWRDGTTIWKSSFDPDDPRYPNFGSDVRCVPADMEGDGQLELLVPGARGPDGLRQLQCLDIATGAVKWHLSLPVQEKPTDPAAADIDGDGRDECIFTIASTLYAVGGGADGRSGAIEWTLSLANYASPVAIADVFGDGSTQIIVCCQNGWVYGIGQRP